MECRDVRVLADDFLSEELLVETTTAVLGHLEHCPRCQRDIDARRVLRWSTREAFETAPSLQARPEFLNDLRAQLRQRAVASRRQRWRWWPVAAGLVLSLGVGSGSLRWWAERGLIELSHLAAGDHQNCALKFALTERPITLAQAADFDPAFGRLERVGFGGPAPDREAIEIVERHSCVFEGLRFGHVVVRYRGAIVSLVVADERASRATAQAATGVARRLVPVGGFNIASFRSAGHAVFVVSTLPPDVVDDLARAVSVPIGRALAGA